MAEWSCAPSGEDEWLLTADLGDGLSSTFEIKLPPEILDKARADGTIMDVFRSEIAFGVMTIQLSHCVDDPNWDPVTEDIRQI